MWHSVLTIYRNLDVWKHAGRNGQNGGNGCYRLLHFCKSNNKVVLKNTVSLLLVRTPTTWLSQRQRFPICRHIAAQNRVIALRLTHPCGSKRLSGLVLLCQGIKSEPRGSVLRCSSLSVVWEKCACARKVNTGVVTALLDCKHMWHSHVWQGIAPFT